MHSFASSRPNPWGKPLICQVTRTNVRSGFRTLKNEVIQGELECKVFKTKIIVLFQK